VFNGLGTQVGLVDLILPIQFALFSETQAGVNLEESRLDGDCIEL
jgi:hypothetical protein